ATASAWAAAAPLDGVYRKLEVLAEVLAQIENHYVDTVAPTDLVYGAARGALSVLDPHSTFFSPDEYKSLLDATEGEYAGIGIEIDLRDDMPEVVSVFDDSPAARAGLRVGDVLIGIDGKGVEGMDFDAVERLLRGPVGSKVILAVAREGREEPWTFTLVRGWVRVAPLTHRLLKGGVTYVWIKSFSRRVASDLEGLLKRAPPKTGLVLDLRGNPGGLFDEAVALCDLFLSDGPIVAVVGRGGVTMEQQVAHPHGTQPPYKIAVLIDRGSASAAEIVAGALHDRGRARLFGERSYGKGSVQSILDLSDGSGLKLTVARYLTPSGKQIDGHGVDPDEELPAAAEGQDPDPVVEAAQAYVAAP
ncbi:MAG TPA: S41 family peptidase, partial [Myxococcota bacterium]|nr:S41 family peptidase [Myxococcota bacterium]